MEPRCGFDFHRAIFHEAGYEILRHPDLFQDILKIVVGESLPPIFLNTPYRNYMVGFCRAFPQNWDHRPWACVSYFYGG